MRTQMQLVGVSCVLVAFVGAVAGDLSGLSLGARELALTSGRCQGECFWQGNCASSIEVTPPGGTTYNTWCTGDVDEAWWCTPEETEVAECGECKNKTAGGCGKYVLHDIAEDKTTYTNDLCDACLVPGDGEC